MCVRRIGCILVRRLGLRYVCLFCCDVCCVEGEGGEARLMGNRKEKIIWSIIVFTST